MIQCLILVHVHTVHNVVKIQHQKMFPRHCSCQLQCADKNTPVKYGSRYSASCELQVASSSCECELRVRVAS